MLSLFRSRGLSSIIYGVIIVGMVLVFVIQFNPSAGKKTASVGEQCVAKVSGWCITPKDHSAAYRILIPHGQNGELLTKRAKSMGLPKIALDGLVERELLIKEADRLGLAVSDDEITDSIFNGVIQVSVPSDNPALAYSLGVQDGKKFANFRDSKTKRFDLKVYRRAIKALMGRSETEFRDEQGRELLAAKVRDLVRAPIRVSEPDATESYIAEKSTATVKYIPVKESYVAHYAIPVTAKDVDDWSKDKANAAIIDSTLTARKADLLPKEKHIRHILVKVPPTATAEDKALALGKLARAYQRIKDGEAFADVAREVSDDTGSAAHGGDVGTATDGFVLPFKKAADALKPGEMTSSAIQTQFGYHLIEKDDPARSADTEAAIKRDIARELYTKTKTLDATKSLAEKLAQAIKGGKSPDLAINDALAPLEKPPAALPALPVISDEPPAAADAGTGEADSGEVHSGLALADAGASRVADAGQKAAPAVAPKAATALTDPDRPHVVNSTSFNQGGDAVPGLPGEAAASVNKFAFSGKDGDVMPEPVRSEDGFFVIQLKEHKLATKDEFEKEKDTYLQTLLAAKQGEALALYVRRLRESAKDEIKIDDKYLAEKMGTADGGIPAPADEDDDEGP